MPKREFCDECGDEILLEPEDTEGHRGGEVGKLGTIEYEDGQPRYLCREHLTF